MIEPSKRLPVHVLFGNITHELEAAAHRNGLTLERAKATGLLDVEIVFDIEPGKPVPPCVDLESKKIYLHEAYLSYLWAMIYSTFVIYELGVQEPMLKGTFSWAIEYNSPLLIRARRLEDWAKRFATEYEEWNEDQLPNPKRSTAPLEASWASKTNNLFLRATTFLIAHEFGHVAGGHDGRASDTVSVEQEKDADNYALAFLADSDASESEKRLSGAALVMLKCSNLFLATEFPDIWARRHPHTHDRIRNAISGLNLQSEQTKFYLYYLAAFHLKQYLRSKNLDDIGAPAQNTAEDLFNWYLDRYDERLEQLKSPI